MECRSAEQNALLLEQMQQLWFNPQLQHYNQQFSTNPVSLFSAPTGQHCVTPHDGRTPPPPPSTHRQTTPNPPPPPEPTALSAFPMGPPLLPCNIWEQLTTSQHPLPFHDHPHSWAWHYIYQPTTHLSPLACTAPPVLSHWPFPLATPPIYMCDAHPLHPCPSQHPWDASMLRPNGSWPTHASVPSVCTTLGDPTPQTVHRLLPQTPAKPNAPTSGTSCNNLAPSTPNTFLATTSM